MKLRLGGHTGGILYEKKVARYTSGALGCLYFLFLLYSTTSYPFSFTYYLGSYWSSSPWVRVSAFFYLMLLDIPCFHAHERLC